MKIKRITSIILILTIMFSVNVAFSEENVGICSKCGAPDHSVDVCPCVDVYINGELMETAKKAEIVNNRTLVPLRSVCEALGCGVYWDNNTRVAHIENPLTKVVVGIGQEYITVKDPRRNGGVPERVDIPDAVPAQILGGYTMVPLRVISEAFGAEVKWHPEDRVVSIKSEYSEVIKLEKEKNEKNENLLAAKKDGEWIVLDKSGTELQNSTVKIEELTDNLIAVEKEGEFYLVRYGIVDVIKNNARNTELKYKTTGEYNYCGEYAFGDNCVKTKKDDGSYAFLDLTAFIDLSDEEKKEAVVETSADITTMEAFSNGLAVVKNFIGSYYIGKDGKRCYPSGTTYADAKSFKDGYAAVKTEQGWGFIQAKTSAEGNIEIKEIVSPQYEDTGDFANGYAAVKKDGRWGFIQIKTPDDGDIEIKEIATEDINSDSGESKTKFKYDEVRAFCKGQEERKYAAVRIGERWGIINGDGSEVIDIEYEYVGDYVNGYAAVKTEQGWGFVTECSKDGITLEEVVAPQYEAVKEFSNGYAAVKKDENKWTFIDNENNYKEASYILKKDDVENDVYPTFEDAKDYNGVLAEVKIDGKWTFVDFGMREE